MSFVGKKLPQPCKKLKPLQDHKETTVIPKVFDSLQKRTALYSQGNDALT